MKTSLTANPWLSRSRTFALAAGIALATLAGCATSQTQIESGQTFLLGGEQVVPLFAKAQNIGPVPVKVYVDKAGKRELIATLAPGETVSHTFKAGETAAFANEAKSRMALMQFSFNDSMSQRSMRYTPNAGPAASAP